MKFCLLAVRKSLGISQYALSKLSGVSRVTISAIETNKVDNVNIVTLYRLARTLNVKISDLIVE